MVEDEKVRCYITVSLDPAKSEMTARAVLHLIREAPAEELTLQINPNLQVTRAQSQERVCDFSQTEAGLVVVALPAEISGCQQVLELDYAGCLPRYGSSEGEARAFIDDDFFWLRDDQYWYPTPVGQEEEELFPIPPGCYIVQMQLPRGWEAASSSPLVRRWSKDLCEYYQWDTQNEYPGISVVGGTLKRHDNGKCTFLWFAPRPDLEEIVLDVLDFCEERLGPFPHFGLTIVIGPDFVPGGYADRALIYISEDRLGRRILSHELVHQWWGRGVWPKHPGDRWVTEGLAEYLSLLYLDSRNESFLGETLEKYQEAFLQTVSTGEDKPVVGVSNQDYQTKGLVSALLYKKGAWLHRMLHFLLQDQYFRTLQIVYSKYQGKFITTDQYIAELAGICEEHREAIETFARQWLHSPGLPRLQIEVVEKTELPDGIEATIVIHQLHQTYQLPIVLEIRAGDFCRRRQVWLSEERTVLKEMLPDGQFSLALDPDHWVMKQVVEENKEAGLT